MQRSRERFSEKFAESRHKVEADNFGKCNIHCGADGWIASRPVRLIPVTGLEIDRSLEMIMNHNQLGWYRDISPLQAKACGGFLYSLP